MEAVHPSCAGIDIGKRSLTVCVIRGDRSGEPVKEIRTFRTLTRDLLRLADWLERCGVRAVAMEATGSYWKPYWNLLEERFELLLANAAHLQGRARPQDGYPRRGVDRRAVPARSAAGELHPAPPGARAAGAGALFGPASSGSAPPRSTGWPRCSRAPTSSWAR